MYDDDYNEIAQPITDADLEKNFHKTMQQKLNDEKQATYNKQREAQFKSQAMFNEASQEVLGKLGMTQAQIAEIENANPDRAKALQKRLIKENLESYAHNLVHGRDPDTGKFKKRVAPASKESLKEMTSPDKGWAGTDENIMDLVKSAIGSMFDE